MSKLTEIIAENKKWNEYFEEHHDKETLVKLEPVNRTIKYLLSLLEEKDKALAVIADENNWRRYDGSPLWDNDTEYPDPEWLARKALNTSSNNEGEN